MWLGGLELQWERNGDGAHGKLMSLGDKLWRVSSVREDLRSILSVHSCMGDFEQRSCQNLPPFSGCIDSEVAYSLRT